MFFWLCESRLKATRVKSDPETSSLSRAKKANGIRSTILQWNTRWASIHLLRHSQEVQMNKAKQAAGLEPAALTTRICPIIS